MKTIAFLIITFLGAVPVSAQHVAVYATGSFNGGTFTPPFGKNDISGLEVRRRINPGVEVVVAPLPYKIVQTPSLIVELFEFVGGFRQIFLDGRKHPADPDPTWLGHSIGRWEGDTLVIDTIGVNDRSWLPAFLPHTEMLHVIERYRRPDLAHLNIDVSIEDPGTFTKPWQLHMVWTLAPREEIEEAVCENNEYIENTRPK